MVTGIWKDQPLYICIRRTVYRDDGEFKLTPVWDTNNREQALRHLELLYLYHDEHPREWSSSKVYIYNSRYPWVLTIINMFRNNKKGIAYEQFILVEATIDNYKYIKLPPLGPCGKILF